MAPFAPPSAVTLKVKVPPGTIDGGSDDIALGSLDTSTTVGAVRERLRELVPSHPRPEQQRLLYGGRVLSDDAQTLADALNTKRDPTQEDYVIHLIVRGEGFRSGPARTSQPTLTTTHGPNVRTSSPSLPHGGPGMAQATIEANIPDSARATFAPFVGQAQQQGAAAGMQGNGHARIGQEPTGPQANIDGHPTSSPAPRPPTNSQGFHLHGIGPDGQRFQMHHQTFNLQHPHVHHYSPNHVPTIPGLPNLPQLPPMMMHGMPQFPPQGPSQQPRVPSALDQARENMEEIRRMLEEMRASNNASEEDRARINSIQERARAINSYIDPLNLGHRNAAPARSVPLATNPHIVRQTLIHPQLPHTIPLQPMPITRPTLAVPVPQSQNPSNVTCYVLSSPAGPQALLFTPQHGAFSTGVSAPRYAQPFTSPIPTPPTAGGEAVAGTPQAINNDAPEPNQIVRHQDPVAEAVHQQAQGLQQAQAQAQGNEAIGPAQAILGHFWLLFRILIFAYFLLGSDLGWRRPLALIGIGLGFWLLRAGLFAEGGVARRWWDDIVAVPNGARGDRQGGQDAAGNGHVRQEMPTPEQLARRLLAERNRFREARLRRIHEWVRPIERVVALFFASLWPGLGEAHARAAEREEARRLEEEVAARRLADEERARVEAEKQESTDAGPANEKSAPEASEGAQGQSEPSSELGRVQTTTA